MQQEGTTGMGVVGVCCHLWGTVLVGLVLMIMIIVIIILIYIAQFDTNNIKSFLNQ